MTVKSKRVLLFHTFWIMASVFAPAICKAQSSIESYLIERVACFPDDYKAENSRIDSFFDYCETSEKLDALTIQRSYASKVLSVAEKRLADGTLKSLGVKLAKLELAKCQLRLANAKMNHVAIKNRMELSTCGNSQSSPCTPVFTSLNSTREELKALAINFNPRLRSIAKKLLSQGCTCEVVIPEPEVKEVLSDVDFYFENLQALQEASTTDEVFTTETLDEMLNQFRANTILVNNLTDVMDSLAAFEDMRIANKYDAYRQLYRLLLTTGTFTGSTLVND